MAYYVPMRVSGFSIVRDGVRFRYPFVESIRSLLPLVDEFVLAVGKSQDETLDQVLSIDSPKLRILETEWDDRLRCGGQVMSQQTNLALDACTGDWCFYLQADEVIHIRDYGRINDAMQRWYSRPHVQGLCFRYYHFYGSYRLVNPLPYRRQVRIIRNRIGIKSVGDACGFALADKRLCVKSTDARIYHYGWARSPEMQGNKLAQFVKLYSNMDEPRPLQDVASAAVPVSCYPFDTAACLPFEGSHPPVMAPVIAAQDWPEPPYCYTPLWRNRKWWDGFFKKNFATIYRRMETSSP